MNKVLACMILGSVFASVVWIMAAKIGLLAAVGTMGFGVAVTACIAWAIKQLVE